MTTPDGPIRSTTLGDIARFLAIDPPEHGADVVVTGIAQDSRVVHPGDLYLARPGQATHGAAHASAARRAGAVATVTDADGADRCRAAGLATLVVADPIRRAGPLAQFVFGEPARALRTIGITGTNGKTTTAFMVAALLDAAGHRCGLVGTVLNRVAGVDEASARSTPEATDLARLMARMVAGGDDACVMEVSSHALAGNRVDGIVFDVAVFLNFSQDHLDLHGSMENYFAAKASLFTPERAARAVIDTSAAPGRRMANRATIDVVRLDTGIRGSAPDATEGADARTPDYALADVSVGAVSSSARLVGPGLPPDGLAFTLPVPGDFNLANAAAALVAVHVAAVDVVSAVDGFATLRVPGHMERYEVPGGIVAVVDFAHTPAAIAAELEALRSGLAGSGRVIAVAGCGGERDPDKRRPMGEALGKGADVVVITDDNPRREAPAAIRAAALAGARAAAHAEVVEIADRRDAIEAALGLARSGDVVAVLGKGHETGQDIGGVVHPFSDASCIEDWSRRHEHRGEA